MSKIDDFEIWSFFNGFKKGIFLENPTKDYKKKIVNNLLKNNLKLYELHLTSSKSKYQDIFYFSDKKLIKWIEKNRYKKTDIFIGKLCGIPKCCVKNYIKFNKYKTHQEIFMDYLTKVKKEDKFNVAISNNKMKFGHTELINFIPCSPYCKNALKILNKNKKLYELYKIENEKHK